MGIGGLGMSVASTQTNAWRRSATCKIRPFVTSWLGAAGFLELKAVGSWGAPLCPPSWEKASKGSGGGEALC